MAAAESPEQAAREQPQDAGPASAVPAAGSGAPRALPAYACGDRVKIVGLDEQPQLNGLTGTLMQLVDERWNVRLDGRGKWLIEAAYFEKLSVSGIPRGAAVGIAGTWKSWEICGMSWDAEHRCYRYDVPVGQSGKESFQILVDRDWDTRLHPDIKDAHPYADCNLLGPDNGGHSMNWTIGKHPKDKDAAKGSYRVRLFMSGGHVPRMVSWTRLDRGIAIPEHTSMFIAGESDGWRPHVMAWDKTRRFYSFRLTLGKSGRESFQFWVDRDPKKCLYPDRADGCPYVDHTLCGPDASGHGQNWTIGKHPLDVGAEGAEYEVRLQFSEDGKVEGVDWLMPRAGDSDDQEIVAAQEKHAEVQELSAAPPAGESNVAAYRSFSIVGSWDNWAGAVEMEWDERERAYSALLRLGGGGEDSFQVLADGDVRKRLHPDRADACPYVSYELCGPHDGGHGRNWTIGRHPLDRSVCGVTFNIKLSLDEDGRVEKVDWSRVAREGERPLELHAYEHMTIVGTWNSWRPTSMTWDEARRCYATVAEMDDKAELSFQILMDGDWGRCLHPAREDPREGDDFALRGPDGNGHGKNWNIGIHPLDAAAPGVYYEIRAFLTRDGCADRVDWLRLG